MLDYKVIIWDFDGVIIFSNEVREDGFREIFKEHGNDLIEKLLNFHRINGGLSRYVKIRYFYEELLGDSITDDQVKVLANEFSEVMKLKLTNKKLLNDDWLQFMQGTTDRFVHHIASGSDGTELRLLCDALGIAHHFDTINGSPTPKNQLVSDIIEANNYQKQDLVLIGDAINDYEAARVNGIAFRGYNNEELLGMGEYLVELKDALK
jgi:phosphoglycolate phosphatase-like HAD superfamily hydrolase